MEEHPFLNIKRGREEDYSARIYLTSLASFTANKTGSYAMSVLKKMTATDNFLELPFEEKNCQTEAYEDCQANRYVVEVQKECGCVPWAFNLTVRQKVSKSLLSLLHLQKPDYYFRSLKF